MGEEYTVDAARWAEKAKWWVCSLFVRAKTPEGKWDSVPITLLDKQSLLAWLRSRGGHNAWAEDVVGILLGHGHLHL